MSNIQSLKQQFSDMLQYGIMPLFEFELNNDDYLLVEIDVTPQNNKIRDIKGQFCKQGIVFSFDTDSLDIRFSGDLKQISCNTFLLEFDPCFDNLDSYLETIYEEIIEGVLIPNNLYK